MFLARMETRLQTVGYVIINLWICYHKCQIVFNLDNLVTNFVAVFLTGHPIFLFLFLVLLHVCLFILVSKML